MDFATEVTREVSVRARSLQSISDLSPLSLSGELVLVGFSVIVIVWPPKEVVIFNVVSALLPPIFILVVIVSVVGVADTTVVIVVGFPSETPRLL